MPWTSYPFSKRSSARYDPSCPVIPVIKAVFINTLFLCYYTKKEEFAQLLRSSMHATNFLKEKLET
jgi:hypothetical protein